jgi:ribosomal protein S18 acetylase RimI-like enzyme
MEIRYRTAVRGDCEALAALESMASHGLVEFLLHDLVPGMTPVQVLARDLEREEGPHSFRNTIVATESGVVVGMALSYASSQQGITDEMRSFIPEERLVPLDGFFSSRVENSWFLDTLAVAESHRRRGIGERLISLTEEKALDSGYRTLSLIVFADNEMALPLYRQRGFEMVQTIRFHRNAYIGNVKEGLLMKRELPL